MNFDEAKRQAAFALFANGLEGHMLLFFEHKGGTKYVRTQDYSDTEWLRAMIKKELAFLGSELYFVSYRGSFLDPDKIRPAIMEEVRKQDCSMERIRELVTPGDVVVVERHHRKEGMDVVHLHRKGDKIHEFSVEGNLISEFDVWNKVQIELRDEDGQV
jgi:hypothetical protein